MAKPGASIPSSLVSSTRSISGSVVIKLRPGEVFVRNDRMQTRFRPNRRFD
jgi:hypothetical protein